MSLIHVIAYSIGVNDVRFYISLNILIFTQICFVTMIVQQTSQQGKKEIIKRLVVYWWFYHHLVPIENCSCWRRKKDSKVIEQKHWIVTVQIFSYAFMHIFPLIALGSLAFLSCWLQKFWKGRHKSSGWRLTDKIALEPGAKWTDLKSLVSWITRLQSHSISML